MEPLIIAVIGAPGTGKTFLVEKLASYLNASKILEENIPKRIIENFQKNIHQTETLTWFRNKCIKDIEKAIELKKQGKIVILDTYWISNELHIPTLVSGFEQEILLKQAYLDKKYLPSPDLVIFLDASEEKIRELILKRGRDYDTNEKFIQRNISIKKAHDDYLQKNKNSLIYINRNNLDFNKQQDIKKVINQITKFH